MDYFLFTKGEERGPYSRQQLQVMWQSGAVTSSSFYWHEGMVERRRVGELFEVATTLPAAPAPIVQPFPMVVTAAQGASRSTNLDMAAITKAARSLSFGPYVLALLCFLLPFGEVSCEGHRIFALTGAQMVTGTDIETPGIFGTPKSVHMDAEPLAVLVLSCVIIGLGACFVKNATGACAAAVSGIAAFLFLMALKSNLDETVIKDGKGLVDSEYLAGFYMECLFLLMAVALNCFILCQMPGRNRAGRTSSS